MAKIVGIHEIELLPGVNEVDFERFVTEEFIPTVSSTFEGWNQHLAKADRGARAGKYALIIELDTAARDRLDEGEDIAAPLAGVMTTFGAFASTTPGVNTIFTDKPVFVPIVPYPHY
jgi:hypothetical protein